MANPGNARQMEQEGDRPEGTAAGGPIIERVHGAAELVPESPQRREFTDRVSNRADFERMPEEYRADCEIGGRHLYVSNWVLTAPNADDIWRMSRIAAEEVDHFRKINKLLKIIGSSADDRLWVDREERYVDAFKSEMPSWADIAVFGMLIDRVGEYQLDEFMDSSFEPLNQMLPPVLAEEKGHVSFGIQKAKDLIGQGRKDELQAAIDRWYPEALDMFGSATSKRVAKYIKWGLKRRTNEEARIAYKAESDAVLRELGLEIPEVAGKLQYAAG